MKQPFYALNDICLQAREVWKLAYINGKTPLVFIFKVSILNLLRLSQAALSLHSNNGLF